MGRGGAMTVLPPDHELVTRLCQRDEAAFALLLDAWSPGMLPAGPRLRVDKRLSGEGRPGHLAGGHRGHRQVRGHDALGAGDPGVACGDQVADRHPHGQHYLSTVDDLLAAANESAQPAVRPDPSRAAGFPKRSRPGRVPDLDQARDPVAFARLTAMRDEAGLSTQTGQTALTRIAPRGPAPEGPGPVRRSLAS
jgi:hypothetical protein